jgi:Mg-chelatase subunit ChlD
MARFSRRLVLDTAGASLVMIAASAVPLVGFVGIGIDAARGYMVKSRLSSALDAAGLAGGWAFFSDNREDDVRMFFAANFPDGYMAAIVTGPTIVADETNEILTVSASAEVPTTFMALFGFDTLRVAAESEVTRQMTALDVVLAIDMSGSMDSSAVGGGTRIEAAREAAQDLVDILFGENARKDFLNIGLVPWSAKVKVRIEDTLYYSGYTKTVSVPAFVNPVTGQTQTEVYYANNSPVPLLSAPTASWKGCVYSRYTNDGVKNDADILMGPTTVGGAKWRGWEVVGGEGEPVGGYGNCALSVNRQECTPCLSNGITPLVNKKASIEAAIDDLDDPNGNTNLTQGLGWAWEVLSPEAPFEEAVLDPDYDRVQAIVLLTDGENNAGSGDGYKAIWGLGYQTEMDDRLLLLANNIKAAGVVIYAIQFANGTGALGKLMKEVASGDGAPYYHYAPDRATLKNVFREVANHLSELRLSR